MKYTSILVLLLGSLGLLSSALPDDLRKKIRSHQGAIDEIVKYVLDGPGREQAFERLSTFTDTYGTRLAGTPELETAINGMKDMLVADELNPTKETVTDVEAWRRGKETAKIIQPRSQELSIMALGSSIGTDGPQEYQVVVVDTREDLDKADIADIKDKLLVFNQPWQDYSSSGPYRFNGAAWAAQKGASAVLIRSVTDFSLYTPHTGIQVYNTSFGKAIPTACITVEDAELLKRLQDAGHNITIELDMEAKPLGARNSSNLVAEIAGSEHKDEVVIFGGHIDSWDVGQGVMDDAGGIIISWQVLSIIKKLVADKKIDPPKRNMRCVMWTAEEIGLIGSDQYYEAHKDEQVSLIMESDYGTFTPKGIGFTGSGYARDIVKEIMSMLGAANATQVDDDGSAPDTGKWQDAGFPVANLYNANDNYFYYHHTHADSITMQDKHDLDLCAIVWTASSYVVASLDDMLPREGEPEPSGSIPMALSATLVVISQLMHFSLNY